MQYTILYDGLLLDDDTQQLILVSVVHLIRTEVVVLVAVHDGGKQQLRDGFDVDLVRDFRHILRMVHLIDGVGARELLMQHHHRLQRHILLHDGTLTTPILDTEHAMRTLKVQRVVHVLLVGLDDEHIWLLLRLQPLHPVADPTTPHYTKL